MKKLRLAVVAGFAASALAFGAVPAHAIDEINAFECNNPIWVDDYTIFGITNSNGTGTKKCFANSGEKQLDIGGVGSFSSGNNSGYFEYEPGDGSRYRHEFSKNETSDKDYGRITKLVID